MKQLLSLLIVLILTLSFSSCSKYEEPVSFEKTCWNQVEDCTTQKLDDGTISVTLKAPDYNVIIMHIAENGIEGDLTLEMINDAINDHPEAVKEYSFIAESDKDEDIKKVLMEQIAYDLLVNEMKDIVE